MKNLNILGDNIEKLQKEFDKLNSIDEIYSFWENHFNTHYVYWYSAHSLDTRYRLFFINTNDKSEIESVNLKNKEFLMNNDNYYSTKFDSLDEKTLSIEHLVDSGADRKFLVEQEVREINDLIYSEKDYQNPNSVQKAIKRKKTPFYTKELRLAYEEYMTYNTEPNYKLRIYNAAELLSLHNGCITAKYHKYLTGNSKKNNIHKDFPHDFQMLILEYLGIGKELKNTQKAELFAPIMNRDIETTRQKFSSLENAKNLERLEQIKSIFKKSNMTNELQKVEKDIDRIKNRKK